MTDGPPAGEMNLPRRWMDLTAAVPREQAHTKSDQAEPYAKQRYEVLNTQMGSKSEPLQFRGLLSTAENLISAKKKSRITNTSFLI